MSSVSRFEDLLFWIKAKSLTLSLYNSFTGCRDYGFKDQILRASVSIMNNIAEGFEKGSNKDFKKFLFIAKGSSAEVRSMLYLAYELKYISGDNFNHNLDQSLEISKMLSGFIKKLY